MLRQPLSCMIASPTGFTEKAYPLNTICHGSVLSSAILFPSCSVSLFSSVFCALFRSIMPINSRATNAAPPSMHAITIAQTIFLHFFIGCLILKYDLKCIFFLHPSYLKPNEDQKNNKHQHDKCCGNYG